MVIGGAATIDLLVISVKLTSFKIIARTYEAITPRMIGIILNIPRPHILKKIIVPIATRASSQFVSQFLMAVGARMRPIEIMIGPVTTGGKNVITFLTP